MTDSVGVAFDRAGLRVFERGWLSANNVFFPATEEVGASLVDSGYVSHAAQTLALVKQALKDSAELSLLVNTHLHSDHCGGNAALQASFPALRTAIPPGESEAVHTWDKEKLSYEVTGQSCDRFTFDLLLHPGDTIRLGRRHWQIHAAAGHDPHSVVLFEPADRILISADALWETGFGVVFPEIEGQAAFDEVGSTLDLIESLEPKIVIPGHGPVFTNVAAALAVARRRLDAFRQHPERHARYAAKVLVKFKLLELQTVTLAQFQEWALSTPYFTQHLMPKKGRSERLEWLSELVKELEQSHALRLADGQLINCG